MGIASAGASVLAAQTIGHRYSQMLDASPLSHSLPHLILPLKCYKGTSSMFIVASLLQISLLQAFCPKHFHCIITDHKVILVWER